MNKQPLSKLQGFAGGSGDAGSIPESERSPGGGNGNPLQYSCLGNLVAREAWWATAHGVTKSLTRVSTGMKQTTAKPQCQKMKHSGLNLKNSPRSAWALHAGHWNLLEKGMATHSSILARRIPWTEEPGVPQSLGSPRVWHDWVTNTHTWLDTPWV